MAGQEKTPKQEDFREYLRQRLDAMAAQKLHGELTIKVYAGEIRQIEALDKIRNPEQQIDQTNTGEAGKKG